jgi:hypothetical protein
MKYQLDMQRMRSEMTRRQGENAEHNLSLFYITAVCPILSNA